MMKIRMLAPLALLVAVLSLLGTACASKRAVDWNARVGSYTYDQVVLEIGPPTRQATLGDGRLIAEWVTGHRGGSGLSVGVGSFTGRTGVGVSQSVGSGGRDRVLRLTFDTDNRLIEAVQN